MKTSLWLLPLLAATLSAQVPSSYPYSKPVSNCQTTGTTQFTATKLNGSGTPVGCALIVATTDTDGFTGIAVSNPGTSGSAWLAFAGFVPLIMDTTSVTVGDWVVPSTTTSGYGKDSGSTTRPTSGMVYGKIQLGVPSGCSGTACVALLDISPNTATADALTPFFIPAANCNNATPGAAWSIGSGGAANCRAGTNNLGGYLAITDTSSTFGQFTITIPEDWDSGTNPYIRFYVASTDTTSAHTIIPAIQVSCAAPGGTTTDDVTFNASHSSSTITLNTTAHQFWSTSNAQLNSTDMTGCSAGSLMIVQVGRATDTATAAEFYGATVTFPRKNLSQAN